AATKTLYFWVNGENVGSVVITADFVNTNSFSFSGSALHGFVMGFNTAITADQARELHRVGNAIPSMDNNALKAACIMHLIADRAGAKMWDMVENYNAWETTPLTANHADLIGFSDAEVGVTDKTTQTVYKEFYDKNTCEWWKETGGVPE